jgi:hypothetical protein
LLRYAFFFDTATMTVGHIPAHEASGELAAPITE